MAKSISVKFWPLLPLLKPIMRLVLVSTIVISKAASPEAIDWLDTAPALHPLPPVLVRLLPLMLTLTPLIHTTSCKLLPKSPLRTGDVAEDAADVPVSSRIAGLPVGVTVVEPIAMVAPVASVTVMV